MSNKTAKRPHLLMRYPIYLSAILIIIISNSCYALDQSNKATLNTEHLAVNPQIASQVAAELIANWESVVQSSHPGIKLILQSYLPMLLIEPESGVIIEANRSAQKYYQYPNLVGSTILSINAMTPEQTLDAMANANLRKQNFFEFQHKLADGAIRDVEVHSFPIEVNNTKLLHSTIIDVTDRNLSFQRIQKQKQTILFLAITALVIISMAGYIVHISRMAKKEKELLFIQTENKLNSLFKAMTEMTVLHEIITDEQDRPINYRIIDCNPAFYPCTGIKREDAIGRLATEVYSAQEAPYLTIFGETAMSGKPQQFETYYPPLNKYFIISCVSVAPREFATITTDISHIKHAEKILAEKNHELENYLFVASHDLRSPLVNIQGFSQRIKRMQKQLITLLSEADIAQELRSAIMSILDDKLNQTLDFIFANTQKMDSLINGLLKISRTGRVELLQSHIDINSMLKEITNARATNDEDKVTFIIDELPNCYGDRSLLNQLFSNLIENAIKYRAPERPPVIKIAAIKDKKQVIYSIQDNGVGIEQRHLEKIWDVFYRVNSQGKITGEGLGLSIVRKIIEKHNGKVWVGSEPDKGTTFYVSLQQNGD